MANHKSAKKRIRRNDKFQLINKIRKTRVRTFIKKVESFIEKKAKIHLIGCGRMGSSILAAWIKKGYPLKNIFVEEPNPSEWLKEKSDEGADAFLIGECLMVSKDIYKKTKKIISK